VPHLQKGRYRLGDGSAYPEHQHTSGNAQQGKKTDLAITQMSQLAEHPPPSSRRDERHQPFYQKDQCKGGPNGVAPFHGHSELDLEPTCETLTARPQHQRHAGS